jgi:hypothetical protein
MNRGRSIGRQAKNSTAMRDGKGCGVKNLATIGRTVAVSRFKFINPANGAAHCANPSTAMTAEQGK